MLNARNPWEAGRAASLVRRAIQNRTRCMEDFSPLDLLEVREIVSEEVKV